MYRYIYVGLIWLLSSSYILYPRNPFTFGKEKKSYSDILAHGIVHDNNKCFDILQLPDRVMLREKKNIDKKSLQLWES